MTMRTPSSLRLKPNQIPVRLEMLDGEAKWRGVSDFEHATLCRAFGLDQASYYFDLPSSVRGVGSCMSGYGGNRNSRVINGFVMHGSKTEPVGKLTICFESEKFKDVDPFDKSDFFKL